MNKTIKNILIKYRLNQIRFQGKASVTGAVKVIVKVSKTFLNRKKYRISLGCRNRKNRRMIIFDILLI